MTRLNEEGYGIKQWDSCRRNGCQGIITSTYDPYLDINVSLTQEGLPMEECKTCGWKALDDIVFPYPMSKPKIWNRGIVDFIIFPHTSSSQKVVGVFPFGTKKEDVKKIVDGTFGGRFEKFDELRGDFIFIAYTD